MVLRIMKGEIIFKMKQNNFKYFNYIGLNYWRWTDSLITRGFDCSDHSFLFSTLMYSSNYFYLFICLSLLLKWNMFAVRRDIHYLLLVRLHI